MRIEIELWQVVTLLSALVGAFWAIGKVLVGQFQRTIEEKFKAVSTGLTEQTQSSRQLERDFMELKAALPRDYVRREDYTQAIATIQIKIDHMALRIEQAIREAYEKSSNRGQA